MANRHGAAALIAVLAFLVAGATAVQAAASGNSTQLLAAVKSVGTQADKFRSMMSDLDASQFHFVNVQSVLSSEQQSAYASAVKKNASDIADLRDTLNHTTVTGTDGIVTPLRKILLAQNLTVGQIVGVYVGSDRQITLFYQGAP